MAITQITHYYGYLEEYTQLTHEIYSEAQPAVFCDYYSLDKINSIWDDNYISSYQDVGDLSGLRWNKVSLYPVFFSEGTPATLNANEKGTTREDSIRPSVVVPHSNCLEPKIYDFLVFTNLNGESLVYQVMNLEYDMPNARAAFKLNLKPSHHTIAEINAVTSGLYVYNDVLDIINQQTIGIPLVHVTANFQKLDLFIRNNFFKTIIDALVDNNVCSLDLNYAQQRLYDVFPTKKVSLVRPGSPDFKFYQADSFIKLLFEPTFSYPSYTNMMTASSNLSQSFTFRTKSTSYSVTNTSAAGTDFLATMYTGTSLTDVNNSLFQLNQLRQGGHYLPSASTVPLCKMINMLVAFETLHTIPPNYTILATNLLEAIFELSLFNMIAAYAIANLIPSL